MSNNLVTKDVKKLAGVALSAFMASTSFVAPAMARDRNAENVINFTSIKNIHSPHINRSGYLLDGSELVLVENGACDPLAVKVIAGNTAEGMTTILSTATSPEIYDENNDEHQIRGRANMTASADTEPTNGTLLFEVKLPNTVLLPSAWVQNGVVPGSTQNLRIRFEQVHNCTHSGGNNKPTENQTPEICTSCNGESPTGQPPENPDTSGSTGGTDGGNESPGPGGNGGPGPNGP